MSHMNSKILNFLLPLLLIPTIVFGAATPITTQKNPGSLIYSGFFPDNNSNYWTNTNTSMGNFTAVGTIPAPTVNFNDGFGTVTKSVSNLPGINFVAQKTGTIFVTASMVLGYNSLTTQASVLSLYESVGGTFIKFADMGFATTATITFYANPTSICGYLKVVKGSTYNIILRSQVSAGTMFIGGAQVSGFSALSFDLHYIN